jgi:hypothetical protein
MFTVDMLPAGQGDCVWIEYGTPEHPHRILIDAGPSSAYAALKERLLAARERSPERRLHFELLIITHIALDHIEGAIELLVGLPQGVTFGQVWFNGWKHLPDEPSDLLGPIEGEQLSALIARRGLDWNEAFDGAGVCASPNGPLPCVSLAGGMQLTLLSPTTAQLVKLRPKWKEAVEDAGLVAGSPEEALQRLKTKETGKVPHHGSKHNLNINLLTQLSCRRYLFSTNGARTKHPNLEAVARVLVHSNRDARLYFNYRTKFNEVWDTYTLKQRYRYETIFPADGHVGLCIDLRQSSE